MRYEEGYSKDSPIYKAQYELVHVSDQVTACSKWLSKKVEEVFSCKNVRAVYNGVDLSRFDEKLPCPCKDQYLFAFGRLEKIKGFDLLIQAYAEIKTDSTPKLLIAGDGTQKETLEHLIEETGVKGSVVLIGRKSSKEIVAYTQNAKAIIISSLRESFGIIALEAIASRRPVLATNSGGLAEVMDSRFGVMVEPSVEGLREGLQVVINKYVNHNETGVKDYLENFTVDRMIDNYSLLHAI